MSADVSAPNFVELAAEIVSAYVSNNPVSAADLPGLLTTVHTSLATASGGPASATAAEAQTPAVPVKKSVTPDYIICLEDGKKLKMLKRHLRTTYGMTPEQYRLKWGLPSDYPMVAPNYAKARSELAKAMGLGQKVIISRGGRSQKGRARKAA
jgi:predicted transcriptional regulator